MILVTWNDNPEKEPIIRGWLKFYQDNSISYVVAILPQSIHKVPTIINFFIFLKILMFEKYSIILCNDVYTAFISLIVGKIRGKKVIYNVQELYSEFVPWNRKSQIKRKLISFREYFLYNFSNILVFPNQARLEHVCSKHYSSKSEFKIFENIPTYGNQREKFVENVKYLVYSGTITESRPIEVLGPLSVYLKQFRIRVVILSSHHSEVDKLTNNYSNIQHISYLEPNEYLSFLSKCFMGVGIYDRSNTNNLLCAPVKLFDFLISGLPFVMVNNPTIEVLKKDYPSVFETFNLDSYESLQSSVEKILSNYDFYKTNIQNIDSKRITFQKYYKDLFEIHQI